ncbi:E3 ubiquitin-protein ligase TRIM21 [Lates calcarifer]|uniref:E3 ubiquitin-protein ligase TRIM21 n=1 Tax=Lates calcarifer TaxID=8187 RepID=A0AAJ7VEI1_LATCA|nr:E3 ubiquitin-protein ligase TRIM21 [Lates calcarifer]
MASVMTEENFICSICLSVFIKPTSIPCGHNFCLGCITKYWNTTNHVFPCPLCKEEFFGRPKLRVNSLIAEMAEKFKSTFQQKSDPEQAGNGNVFCDKCAGAKVKALKTCIVCFMSYCETHLEPHQRILSLKKHKLIEPVENLESRMCKTHGEYLELFCQKDQEFLCQSCKDSDHTTHKIVALEEEAQVRKTQLVREKKHTDQMIEERLQKIWEFQNSMKANRDNAAEVLSCSLRVMTAVVDYMKRSQAELSEVIEMKQKKTEKEAKGFIKELEGEIMQIKQQSLQLNQVSLDADPFTLLEKFISLTIMPPQVKEWSDVTLNRDQFIAQGAWAKLETTIMREISMVCDPDLKEKQQHAVDVSLDPDTANLYLTVSADGKQVTHGDRKRNLPDKPERFGNVFNVLAKDGFSAGKFYYEVQVKDKTQWNLGLANQSINRKGDMRLSPMHGYWTIWLRNGHEFQANAGPAVNLPVRERLQKVGVFVDYETGQVSFYDVDARAHIYSFTGCNFTERIFPFFSPSVNDGGKNSAPLIITPVKYEN